MPSGVAQTPTLVSLFARLLEPHPAGFLLARTVFLRGLGLVFFSAFYSYLLQVQGLIGPRGILPANTYLQLLDEHLDVPARAVQVPTLFHITGAGQSALWCAVILGLFASKLASGDPQWRHLTALDHYYENGPLPTVFAWYAQHLPHAVHVATAVVILALELGVVWLAFFPRRWIEATAPSPPPRSARPVARPPPRPPSSRTRSETPPSRPRPASRSSSSGCRWHG